MAESHILQNAQGFVMNNSQVVNSPQIIQVVEAEKQGLKILLEASTPAAAYDSSEHPRHCHPGTRYRYIDQIVDWGLNSPNHRHRIFWLKGPAGVGKSAIAQSCAEEFAARGKLAAAFFFSHPNQRDDPQCLFTSISYQWASKHRPYAEILKSTIHADPTIVEKELPHQFHHLFVLPLQELEADGEEVPERVVIIDGLDECAGEVAQRTIIKVVAASIQRNTTPFVWIFCSRLEPHLIATFNSRAVSMLTHQEELTVSRAIDSEIAKYLTDELAGIAEEHGLPLPWPHQRDIGTLINLSSGLFIYASTVIRFISDRNSFGPEDQLRAILALATSVAGEPSEHPLSELDFFYLLIVQRIPSKLLQTVQWILLATTIPGVAERGRWISQLLDLSTSQFHTACRTLHAVMKVDQERKESKIVFYHASFMEFMQDPQRSKQFCIRLGAGLALRADLVRRLEVVCNNPDIEPYSDSFYALIRAAPNNGDATYGRIVLAFFFLCSTIPWDTATLATLVRFKFKRMAQFGRGFLVRIQVGGLFQHIPEDHRSKIIRPCKDRDRDIYAWEVMQMPDDADWNQSYILGHGQRKCFLWSHPSGDFHIQPYIEPPIVEPLISNVSTADCDTVEHLAAEQPPAAECPASVQMVIECPASEQMITECPTTECPSTMMTNRTFMQRIKFWRTPTSRRLIRQIRALVRVRDT